MNGMKLSVSGWLVDEHLAVLVQELIREVAILNERLPNHIAYTERNIGDHEVRLRALEEQTPKNLREQLNQINQFRWVLVGIALASGTAGAWLTKALGM